jgi:hypothetical protein
MIIDSHMHAGYSDALRHSWDTFEDIRVSLERMDHFGIDQAVVLPIGHDNFEIHNRQTARIVAEHPGRLVGYAKVSQQHDAGRVGSLLEEAFEKLHLRGLKLHGHPNREIMDVMKRYKKPALVDVHGEVYPLRYVAEQYPDVPLIIAHMGKFLAFDGAVRQATLWLCRTYPDVYFDTSSVNDHEWLQRAVDEGMVGRMIFGSDGPGLHCGVELARVKALMLSPADEAMVRLLGLNDV